MSAQLPAQSEEVSILRKAVTDTLHAFVKCRERGVMGEGFGLPMEEWEPLETKLKEALDKTTESK
jgi:hypothetical protein